MVELASRWISFCDAQSISFLLCLMVLTSFSLFFRRPPAAAAAAVVVESIVRRYVSFSLDEVMTRLCECVVQKQSVFACVLSSFLMQSCLVALELSLCRGAPPVSYGTWSLCFKSHRLNSPVRSAHGKITNKNQSLRTEKS